MYIGGNFWQIIILIMLIFGSAYFSGSETALMSLSKIRIRHMVEEEVKGAKMIQKLIQNPNNLLGTVLVGNTVINIGASALATSIAINAFGARGALISTGVMTVVVLIFSEITPKSLAASNSEGFSLKIAKTMTMCVFVLKPLVIVFTHITSGILNIFGVKVNRERPFITEEELKTIVDVSQEQGVLEVEEKDMIHNVFEFGDLMVRDVMVQRMDIVGVDLNSTMEDIMKVIKEERFSRLAVYNENIDNIRKSISRQVPKEIYDKATLFHLRGGIDYKQLSLKHKTMMSLLYIKAKNLPEEKKTAEVRAMIVTYNQKVNFIDYDCLNQIIENIK